MKECMYYMAMIGVQVAYAGSNILIKISLDRGLHPLVFVVYRHLIALLLLAPFAYALERFLLHFFLFFLVVFSA